MLPENWDIVQTFLRVQTRWVRAGMTGVPTGLDYCQAEAVWRLAGIVITPEIFEGVETMEYAALPIMNETNG